MTGQKLSVPAYKNRHIKTEPRNDFSQLSNLPRAVYPRVARIRFDFVNVPINDFETVPNKILVGVRPLGSTRGSFTWFLRLSPICSRTFSFSHVDSLEACNSVSVRVTYHVTYRCSLFSFGYRLSERALSVRRLAATQFVLSSSGRENLWCGCFPRSDHPPAGRSTAFGISQSHPRILTESMLSTLPRTGDCTLPRPSTSCREQSTAFSMLG